jgi:multidrug resistance protein, MATE family
MFKQILQLAWPMLIGQLAVMANGLIDTVMAGRLSATDLAAVGLGSSIQITVYVSLNGIIMGMAPILGQHYGAKRFSEIGKIVSQGIWLALCLSVLGVALLLMHPVWLSIIQAPIAVAPITANYLWMAAIGMPAALMFRVFYTTSTSVSLPRVVMVIQLACLALKVPLNGLFIYGLDLPLGLQIPALGGAGCGLSTSLLSWVSALLAWVMVRTDQRYTRFNIQFGKPVNWNALKEVLRLGIPIGASYAIEVSSFTFIAMFVARFGIDVAAAHQISSNLLGMAYMVPLALSNAVSTLVAQSIGAQAWQQARQIGKRGIGIVIGLGCVVGAIYGLFSTEIAALYVGGKTDQASLIANAAVLIKILAIFVVFDAMQTVFAFVLRAYKIATLPSIIYAVSLWGLGIGAGWWLSYVAKPSWAAGAAGFWWAAVAGVMVAAAAFMLLLRHRWQAAD